VDDLNVYKSVADVVVENSELVLNFAHGRCRDSDIDTDHVYINKIPFYTNHSSDNNISFRIRTGKKLTYAIRDVEAGEEMLQNYEEYTTVPWFENYLRSIDKVSLRELGIKYNMLEAESESERQ
jgi:SET domain-containing protein